MLLKYYSKRQPTDPSIALVHRPGNLSAMPVPPVVPQMWAYPPNVLKEFLFPAESQKMSLLITLIVPILKIRCKYFSSFYRLHCHYAFPTIRHWGNGHSLVSGFCSFLMLRIFLTLTMNEPRRSASFCFSHHSTAAVANAPLTHNGRLNTKQPDNSLPKLPSAVRFPMTEEGRRVCERRKKCWWEYIVS